MPSASAEINKSRPITKFLPLLHQREREREGGGEVSRLLGYCNVLGSGNNLTSVKELK